VQVQAIAKAIPGRRPRDLPTHHFPRLGAWPRRQILQTVRQSMRRDVVEVTPRRSITRIFQADDSYAIYALYEIPRLPRRLQP
jgi:hypothetical protein